MNASMNAVTSDTVEVLKLEMDRSFEVFSDRHAETETAETKLREAAQTLAALSKRRRAVASECERLTQSAVLALTDNPSEKLDTSKLTCARVESRLLDSAIEQFTLQKHADLERGYLLAIVVERESQLTFEQARLAHHEGQLAMLLSQAVALDGSLELAKPGEVSTQLREVCADIRDKLTRARSAVTEFEQRLAADRARHENSQGETR